MRKKGQNRNSDVEDVDEVDFKQPNPEEEEKEIANNQTMSTTLEHDNNRKNNQAGKPPLVRQSHDFPSNRLLDVSPLKSKLTMLYESQSANGGDPA